MLRTHSRIFIDVHHSCVELFYCKVSSVEYRFDVRFWTLGHLEVWTIVDGWEFGGVDDCGRLGVIGLIQVKRTAKLN